MKRHATRDTLVVLHVHLLLWASVEVTTIPPCERKQVFGAMLQITSKGYSKGYSFEDFNRLVGIFQNGGEAMASNLRFP